MTDETLPTTLNQGRITFHTAAALTRIGEDAGSSWQIRGTRPLHTRGTVDPVPQLIPPSAAKSAEMSRVQNRHTAPELALRRELHRRGLRYRVDLPLHGMGRTRPDIVFTRIRVAVFVDGCFWHCCPEHQSYPKTNAEWWREKLATNVKRDRRIDKALTAARWEVIRVWEHEDVMAAADRVEAVVRSRRSEPIPQDAVLRSAHTSVSGNTGDSVRAS